MPGGGRSWCPRASADSTPRPKRDQRKLRFGQGSGCLPSLRLGNINYDFPLVFGRVPAELGPETRSIGSGSKNAAERTQKLAPETNAKAVS